MYIKLREKKAFTLVEIMIVVAIIGLLVAIAIPNFVRARTQARAGLCENNRRLVAHAAEQFIIDNDADDWADGGGALVDLADYIKGGVPECPLDPGTAAAPLGDDNDYSIANSPTTDGVEVSCLEAPLVHIPPYDTGTPGA